MDRRNENPTIYSLQKGNPFFEMEQQHLDTVKSGTNYSIQRSNSLIPSSFSNFEKKTSGTCSTCQSRGNTSHKSTSYTPPSKIPKKPKWRILEQEDDENGNRYKEHEDDNIVPACTVKTEEVTYRYAKFVENESGYDWTIKAVKIDETGYAEGRYSFLNGENSTASNLKEMEENYPGQVITDSDTNPDGTQNLGYVTAEFMSSWYNYFSNGETIPLFWIKRIKVYYKCKNWPAPPPKILWCWGWEGKTNPDSIGYWNFYE